MFHAGDNWDAKLTEGTKRAVVLAARLARNADSGGGGVEPMHLLWALALEESRASEMLAGFDVTSSTLPELSGLSDCAEVEFQSEGESDGNVAVADVAADSLPLQHLLWEANVRRNRVNRGEELNSLHLLWALLTVDSPAADVLQQRGMTRDAFSPSPEMEVMGEPIAVDFELNLPGEKGIASVVRGSPDPALCRTEGLPDARQDAQPPEKRTPETLPTLRTLDAAANRAREGLRVVEDFTRFHLNDGHLSRALKECRHRLTAALQAVDPQSLLKLRDATGDVGAAIETPAEARRESPRHVAAANLKRVQESLRSLEEFGKTLSADFARKCEAERYRLYTLEQAVLNTAANRDRLRDRRLYLLLTRDLCRRNPETVLSDALAAGVDVIQIREKSLSDRDLLDWCRRVREMVDRFEPAAEPADESAPDESAPEFKRIARRRPLLVVNDRPDLAVLCRADGVHVGQEELPVAAVRRIVGPEMLVGVSTHNIEQARRAVLDGADYLGVGPVFPSQTKTFTAFAGLEFVQQVAAEIGLPWFAIGGIRPENATAVFNAGGERIAVSGAICGAEQVAEVAGRFRDALCNRRATPPNLH